MRKAILLAGVTFFAVPAFAQAPDAPEPAAAGTAEGAKAVADDLAVYVSRSAIDKGIIRVEPDPAGYRITFDPKPLLESMADKGTKFAMSPYSVVVSSREDGNWNYFTNGPLDISADTTVNGVEQTIDYDIGPQLFKGIYSPTLAAFLSGSGSIDGLTMRTGDAQSDIAASIGKTSFDLTGTPAGDGAANISTKQTIADFNEAVSIKQAPEMPPGGVAFSLNAVNANVVATATSARLRQLLDLEAFFIAHPEFADSKADKAKLAAAQDEMKSRLRAVLPVWKRFEGSYDLSKLAVKGDFGSVNADGVKVAFGADGVSRSGTFSYDIGFAGLKVVSAMMPAWAESLAPSEMELKMKIENIDLQTPSDIALADLDVTRTDLLSEDAQRKISDSFTANPPRFVIAPSRLKSRDLDVTMAGSFAMTADRPAMTMDFQAAGVDKAIATLQTAAQSDPVALQIAGGLSMAKGFGKPLPDGRTQWLVEAQPDGAVSVNGFQLKGPDIQTVPDDAADGVLPDDEGIAPDGEVPLDEAPTDDNALPDAIPAPQ